MDEGLPFAKLVALQHMGPVGNHFVNVHVGLGARSGLPDDQRELVGQLAREYLIAYLGDEVTLFRGQYSGIGIGVRRGLFKVRKCFDDFLGIEAEGPILKLLRERSACAPQYLSAGTCTSPMVSCSIRYDMESLFLYVAKVRRYRRCENVSHIALRRWLNSSPAIPISNVPAAIASIRGACGMGVRANPETPCAIKSNSFHITPATKTLVDAMARRLICSNRSI